MFMLRVFSSRAIKMAEQNNPENPTQFTKAMGKHNALKKARLSLFQVAKSVPGSNSSGDLS